MKNTDDIFEVKDIALASYLYSLCDLITFIGKKRLPTGEVFFQFSPRNKAESLITQYWSQKAPFVQPKRLFNAQRDLKDMIFGNDY